ncbi:16S rRNA (cytidine(1402)-2'-O)-methyltransferase, partial [Patescibacteria group bacterium]|nr:16S rRNA (cytidine(1402)-2'-O)-methyltransferase [Patescibacteria group bacterium]
ESPHRIEKTLVELHERFGSARRVSIARELTKMYEETIVGTATEVMEYFRTHTDHVRGEFVVIVDRA